MATFFAARCHIFIKPAHQYEGYQLSMLQYRLVAWLKVFRWFASGIKILLALGEEAMDRTQTVVGFPISEVEWY